jgi:hypothetical protein
MDYDGLIKSLRVPTGFAAPAVLRYDGLRAEVLTRDHLHDDVAGINRSVELIRRTRGGDWPGEPVTEQFDYVDLVWHECETRDGKSFGYAVYDDGDEYLGCCYFYPVGIRTPLSAELVAHDVDVSWWVTPEAYAAGHYVGLYRALRQWSTSEFPFTNPHYSNLEIPDLPD